MALVGAAVAEASPDPSHPAYGSSSHQPAIYTSSYYKEPVNIYGKDVRADVSLTFVYF